MGPRLCLLLFAISLVGCTKKSSREYFEAQGQHDSLTAREGDEAYLTPEMDAVAAKLSAVPANAIEYARAQELLVKVRAENTRMRAEQAALERDLLAAQEASARQPDLKAMLQQNQQVPTEPGPLPIAVVLDAGSAGPGYPVNGMTQTEFSRAFGACVQAETTFDRGGGQKAVALPVVDSEACQRKLRVPPGTLMLFVDGKLLGSATPSEAAKKAAAAANVAYEAAKAAAAQAPVIVLPGSPIPAGYTGVPGVGIGPGTAPAAPGGTLQPRTN